MIYTENTEENIMKFETLYIMKFVFAKAERG